MGDRIVVMNEGRIQQVDTPINVYEHPVNKFVAGFIGSPAMNFFEGRLVRNGGLVFDDGAVRIQLPDSLGRQVEDYIDKEITLGIRPEAIYSDKPGERAAAGFDATVELVEPMGNVTYLYLNTGKNSLIARADAHTLPRLGEKLAVGIDMERIHLFAPDGATII